ncbi:MAG: peptidoglycan bridge formation glycyltransferase FemA/FemB family protein, partial [Patescibacteria group bacterium]
LLQWEAIKEAKNRGCRFYNFWGIAPENNPKHPWAGLTLFKKGFGGFSEEYIPAHDFVIKYSYWFVCLIEKIRKIRRGL